MPSFSLNLTSEKEIGELITNLKNSHAYGIDRMDVATFKMFGSQLIPAVTHVVNLSLRSGIFPAKWKLARVLPLLKGKDVPVDNPGSYRPVSQLPVTSKLAERVVQRQLLQYLENNNLLSENHHAYREQHNTMTALIQYMDAIATATDENLMTATMCINLSAAFDCVSHETLKKKLEFYGLDKKMMDWIASYLDSRSSFVSIGSADSRIVSTPHGVLQGSVMGPMLYLIYVNEMTNVIQDDDCPDTVHSDRSRLFPRNCRQCGVFPMFADDGMFQYSSNSRNMNQEKIETNFWKIKAYLNANGLQVNEDKTNLTEFMCQQKKIKDKRNTSRLNSDSQDYQ